MEFTREEREALAFGLAIGRLSEEHEKKAGLMPNITYERNKEIEHFSHLLGVTQEYRKRIKTVEREITEAEITIANKRCSLEQLERGFVDIVSGPEGDTKARQLWYSLVEKMPKDEIYATIETWIRGKITELESK